MTDLFFCLFFCLVIFVTSLWRNCLLLILVYMFKYQERGGQNQRKDTSRKHPFLQVAACVLCNHADQSGSERSA